MEQKKVRAWGGTMMNLIGVVTAAVLLFMVSGNAQASNCSIDEYGHNGSVMEVQMCDNELYISYSKPKSSLRKIGVRRGTTLFEGRVSKIGAVSGTAYRFSASCGEIAYDVEGAIRPNSILLDGQAPVRNKRCQITEYRYDELLFTLNGYAEKMVNNDWYAIAGAFRDRNSADRQVRKMPRQWQVMNTRDCPNFTRGYWVVVAGPMSERDAQRAADSASRFQAYPKQCN
jgi:hypothetical protein